MHTTFRLFGFMLLVLTLAPLARGAGPSSRPANAVKDPSGLLKMTWKIGETTREALVYLPPATSKNPPLLFAFHGHGSTAQFSARVFAFHKLWPDAICIYPQGIPTPAPGFDPEGKSSGWQKFVGDQKDRDLLFFDAIVQSMKDDRHIDEKRIYISGQSDGGFFCYVLWAARGDVLAAIAPSAALVDPRDQKLLKPKPVLHVAGEQDTLVKFDLQQKTIADDRKLNGCDPQGKPAGNLCTQYSSKNGPPVIAYIHPGGHGIPPEAPVRIVQFFKDNPMKENASPAPSPASQRSK